MKLELTINGIVRSEISAEEIERALANATEKFLEVWIKRENETTCMLSNEDKAWLMFQCFYKRHW